MRPRLAERRYVSPLLVKETSGRMARRTYSLLSPKMNRVVTPVYRRILKLLSTHGNLQFLRNLNEAVPIGKHRVTLQPARRYGDEYFGTGSKGILRATFLGKSCFVKIDYLYYAKDIVEGYSRVNQVLTHIGNKVGNFSVRTPHLQMVRDTPNKEFAVCVTDFYPKEDVQLAFDLREPEKTQVSQVIDKVQIAIRKFDPDIGDIDLHNAFYHSASKSIILFDLNRLPLSGDALAILETGNANISGKATDYSIPSRMRGKLVQAVPRNMERAMEAHASIVHGLGFTKIFDANSLLQHAAQVDLSKISRRPRDWVSRDPSRFLETEIRQPGSGDYRVRLLPIGKSGNAVLYKAWGVSGTTQNQVRVRLPEKTNQFFVINPQRKSLSLYYGAIDEP